MSCSESELDRVSSTKSTADIFDKAPEDQDYRFKLFDWNGHFLVSFVYKLKKGKELPYLVPKLLKGGYKMNCGAYSIFLFILGYNVEFSSELIPTVQGFQAGKREGIYWVFEKELDLSSGAVSISMPCIDSSCSFVAQACPCSILHRPPPHPTEH